MHIESGMVTVTEFSRAVMPHGTTTMFVDPHEIANVLGIEGIRLMHDETLDLPINVFLQIPSCVPSAPGLETAGASLEADEISEALTWQNVCGLGEVMNFPGVAYNDKKMVDEISATWDAKKTIKNYREEKYKKDDLNGSIQIYGQGNGFKQSESDKIFIIEQIHLEEPLYANVRFLGSPKPYLKTFVPVDEFNFEPKYLPYYNKYKQNLTHPNFIIEKNNTLYVKSGKHICKTNIIVPRNKVL